MDTQSKKKESYFDGNILWSLKVWLEIVTELLDLLRFYPKSKKSPNSTSTSQIRPSHLHQNSLWWATYQFESSSQTFHRTQQNEQWWSWYFHPIHKATLRCAAPFRRHLACSLDQYLIPVGVDVLVVFVPRTNRKWEMASTSPARPGGPETISIKDGQTFRPFETNRRKTLVSCFCRYEGRLEGEYFGAEFFHSRKLNKFWFETKWEWNWY